MSTIRITSSELERDPQAVLRKARDGFQVVVEQEAQPDVVSRVAEGPGRPLSECLARALAFEAKLGEAPLPDPDFEADVLTGIRERSAPLDPPRWD